MTRPPVKVDWSFNVGTMIHLLVLVVMMVSAWGAFDRRTTVLELEVNTLNATVDKIERRTEKIDQEMLRKDPEYRPERLWLFQDPAYRFAIEGGDEDDETYCHGTNDDRIEVHGGSVAAGNHGCQEAERL